MKFIGQRLVMGVLLAGALVALGGAAAMAQNHGYNNHYQNQWYQNDRRHNGWRDQNDWNRRHPSVYVAPGYAYYPPPVVYAPPPVHPGLNFYFGF